MAISWSAARTKVRGDLWKSASGVPDDVVDRALHSSLREIESKRRWLWLEKVSLQAALVADANTIALPADLQSVETLSFQRADDDFFDPPLQRVLVTEARMLASSVSFGWPSKYGLNGLTAYLDCTAPAGSRFDLVYNAKTPTRLEDAIAAASLVTLDLQQNMVIAGAAASVALSFLRDENNAGRHQAKFDRMLLALEDEDDAARTDVTGPRIMPDTAYQDATR